MGEVIYTHQCTTCGVNAHYIRRVQRHYPDVIVYDTRYEAEQLPNHIAALKHAGMETDQYAAIVVAGGTITRLEEWKP